MSRAVHISQNFLKVLSRLDHASRFSLLSVRSSACKASIGMGSQPAAFSELFPPSVRYSGASLSLTLGNILGGALAPLIATALFRLTGNSRAITAYLATLSLISLLC